MPRASVIDHDGHRVHTDTCVPTGPSIVALAARLDALDRRVAALESDRPAAIEPARRQVLDAIVTTIGPGVMFSGRELWRHRHIQPEIRTALGAARIRSTQQLGKCLEWLGKHPGDGFILQRLGDNNQGAIWSVTVR